MRKRANHLLEFLSDKNDTRDLLSQWLPAPAAQATAAEEPHEAASSSAADAAASTSAAAPLLPFDDVPAPESVPFAQRTALRRVAETTRVFADLDARVAAIGAGASDSRATLDMLEQVQGAGPLRAALGTPHDARRPCAPSAAWFSACDSDAMLCAGLPALRCADSSQASGICDVRPPAEKPRVSFTAASRLPTHRAGVPRAMARNIHTLRRLYRTHQKFFTLAEAVELELPVPASLADSDDDDGPAPPSVAADLAAEAERPSLSGADQIPAGCTQFGAPYARAQMNWQVQTILAHAGFEGAGGAATQVLSDVASEYLMGLAQTLRQYADRYARRMRGEDMVLYALQGVGATGVDALRTYISLDIERYGVRLREWLRKLQGALREQLAAAGGTIEDSMLLDDDGEALALGHFAAGLGDDYFGFRELGLEDELGVRGLAVPSHLFFGRGSARRVDAPAGEAKAAPGYAPPPPAVPITRGALAAQPGLVRAWLASRLHAGNAPGDTLPDETPERPRYKVPTTGKLPVPALVGSEPPAKRHRT